VRRVVLILVGVASALVAGCAAEQVAGEPIGLGDDAGTIFEEPPATTTAAPGTPPPDTAPPGPAETIPNFPQAKDGSDVAACYDGTCEVEVRAPLDIPLDPAITGVSSLTLVRVDEVNGATLTGVSAGGGTIEMVLYADPGGQSAAVFNNRFSVAALATVNGRAVLRISVI
jgi:hypothetical protein